VQVFSFVWRFPAVKTVRRQRNHSATFVTGGPLPEALQLPFDLAGVRPDIAAYSRQLIA
jgi:hypothetical protein